MSSPKHFQLLQGPAGSGPALLFEVRLDIRDNRSGFAGSALEHFTAPLVDDADLEWARDMVEAVDPAELEEIQSPGPVSWPEMADNKLIRYLVHNYRRLILVNAEMQVYSEGSETRDEFVNRCLQLLVPERRGELDMVRDVFLRRFLELETRCAEIVSSDEWTGIGRYSQLANLRDAFSVIRENFSSCFLGDDFACLPPETLRWRPLDIVEIEERLQAVRAEFISRFNEITESALERAGSVEPYEVPVSPSHIDIVSRGFLWR